MKILFLILEFYCRVNFGPWIETDEPPPLPEVRPLPLPVGPIEQRAELVAPLLHGDDIA
jgi:hypothetical protein